MRHLRMVGLALVAVLATTALVATSASALPEWGQCYVQAKHEGKYANAGCTVKAKVVNTKPTGEFEWRKGPEIAEKHFSGANVGSGGVLTTELHFCYPNQIRVSAKKCVEGGGEVREPLGTASVECESEANHGEAKGTKEVANISVIFHGCKLFGSAPCSNSSEEGAIVVNTLKGALGYINKAKKEVGVLLEPAVKKGEFVKFICGGFLATVVGVGNETEGAAYSPEKTGGYDGIISPITPVNTMSSKFTQVYTINAGDENIPSKFEGKHIELLEDYAFNAEKPELTSMWSKAGEAVTNVNTQGGGEEVEIKA
jgi:hypothetical protein